MNFPKNDLKTKYLAIPSREKQDKTYSSAGTFLESLRANEIIEGFFLTEDAFNELMGCICTSLQVCKEINDKGVLILLKADRGAEVDGLVAFAQGVIDGNKMAQNRNRV